MIGVKVAYGSAFAVTGASMTAAWFIPWFWAFLLGAATVFLVLLALMWWRGDFK